MGQIEKERVREGIHECIVNDRAKGIFKTTNKSLEEMRHEKKRKGVISERGQRIERRSERERERE